MIRSTFVAMLMTCVICSFCGQDFVALGRHSWRCKQRINQAEQDQPGAASRQVPVMQSPNVPVTSRTVVKCCCGKICKGARGLKMHQRSCQVIHSLNDELCADLEEQIAVDNTNNTSENNNYDNDNNNVNCESFPELKKGIKLPKNDSEWSTANDYFKFALQTDHPIAPQDINSKIKLLNDAVYNYFADNYGYCETVPDQNLITKYKEHTVKELKKALQHLKSNKGNLSEIKYVSRALRDKLRNNSNNADGLNSNESFFNHDQYLRRNFWGYVKNILNKKDAVLPSFKMNECLSYFSKTLTKINPNKLFVIPSWIPKLSDPVFQFDLDPPTYQQITNIIRKMKSSGSPCPLDQLSIICFKRCPYLRSYLTELIHETWRSGTVPTVWKRACTILIHKKGHTDDPSNFRPITLESVPLKVFTSCLRNAIYSFLTCNNFIEQNIQKGFTPNLSGTLEHTAQMADIINKARIRQRSVVITLLDLKNAFGEVHHNLIQSVLDYHHIPDHIRFVIKSLYTDFQTSIITSEFQTPFLTVGRGVLQGDCLSPLLFNMCFNTFIQHIKAEKYRQFGFSFKMLNPIHWFQFADDAAVITSQESENQHLLNRFSVWCQWSDMIIRVDKCSTFGIKKAITKSVQYLPKLLINNRLIPAINIGESFQYLGRYFDFDMSNNNHKAELTTLVNDLMADTDTKPLHPKNKLLLYSRYVLSKLSWHFTVATLSKTWVTENIDPIVNQYIRKWLEVPISGTLSTIFLTNNKFGLSIHPPSVKFIQCQTVLRIALKSSPNESINYLWKSTNNYTNIQYDGFKSTKEVLKDFRSGQEDKLKNQLSYQGSFFSSVTKFAFFQLNKVWSNTQSKLPKNIYTFTIRYINNSLPTRTNLKKWGISSTSECSFCLNQESLLHVVAGCQSYLDRFTWRHNSILNFLAQTLQSVNGYNLFADVPGFRNPSIITGDRYRPDLLLTSSNNSLLYLVELTVGYESNLESNIRRKNIKYKELVKQQRKYFKSVKFVNISISSLGVFAKESSTFLKMLDDIGFDDKYKRYCIRRMMAIAIRTSYYIFCRRNKEWGDPQLLAL